MWVSAISRIVSLLTEKKQLKKTNHYETIFYPKVSALFLVGWPHVLRVSLSEGTDQRACGVLQFKHKNADIFDDDHK